MIGAGRLSIDDRDGAAAANGVGRSVSQSAPSNSPPLSLLAFLCLVSLSLFLWNECVVGGKLFSN